MDYRKYLYFCPSLFFRLSDPSESDFKIAVKTFADYCEKSSMTHPIRWENEWTEPKDKKDIQQYLLEPPALFISKVLKYIDLSDDPVPYKKIFESCFPEDFWEIPLRKILRASQYIRDSSTIFNFLKFLFDRFGVDIPNPSQECQNIYVNLLASVIPHLTNTSEIISFYEKYLEDFNNRNKLLVYPYVNHMDTIKLFEAYRDILSCDGDSKEHLIVKQDMRVRLNKVIDESINQSSRRKWRINPEKSQIINDMVRILIVKLNNSSFDASRICKICNELDLKEGEALFSLWNRVEK